MPEREVKLTVFREGFETSVSALLALIESYGMIKDCKFVFEEMLSSAPMGHVSQSKLCRLVLKIVMCWISPSMDPLAISHVSSEGRLAQFRVEKFLSDGKLNVDSLGRLFSVMVATVSRVEDDSESRLATFSTSMFPFTDVNPLRSRD